MPDKQGLSDLIKLSISPISSQVREKFIQQVAYEMIEAQESLLTVTREAALTIKAAYFHMIITVRVTG